MSGLTEKYFDGEVDSVGDLGLNQVAGMVDGLLPGGGRGGGGGRTWAEGGGADLDFSGPMGTSSGSG